MQTYADSRQKTRQLMRACKRLGCCRSVLGRLWSVDGTWRFQRFLRSQPPPCLHSITILSISGTTFHKLRACAHCAHALFFKDISKSFYPHLLVTGASYTNYRPISTGHSGKHGHEFLEFEYSHGRLRYANNSNYRNDSLIRKESEESRLFCFNFLLICFLLVQCGLDHLS